MAIATATARKKPAPAADDKPEERAPIVPTEETLIKLADAVREDPDLGVLCLIGDTQVGKTWWWNWYARERAMRVAPFNPQCDLPEDIAGWPRSDKGRRVVFTYPPILPPDLIDAIEKERDEPWLLLGDEADKAQHDTLSTLLTLLNPDERRLRRTVLRKSMMVGIAMNPPKRPLPDPLVARLLFVTYPLAGSDVTKRFRRLGHIAEMLFGDTTWTSAHPERPITPGSLHKLERWAGRSDFLEDEALQHLVVYGLFPPQVGLAILGKLRERPVVPGVEWAVSVSAADLPLTAIAVINALPQDQRKEVLKTLVDRANADPTSEFMRVFQEQFPKDPKALANIVPCDGWTATPAA